MADPVFIDCPVDVWTKVATAVTTGTIWVKKTNADYFQTIRNTGEAAPANNQATFNNEAIRIDKDGQPIGSVDDIDVYIFCTKIEGRARVDLPD